MSYFREHSLALTLKLATADYAGLRNNQLGAIHAVLAHFTLHDEPALVAMPTGSGKTGVLMALCFGLRPRRVLVVTPSVIVRDQIATGFRTLEVLKTRAEVLPADLPTPQVYEVTGLLRESQDWTALEAFDVVVASPPSVSPAAAGVAPPPPDLFDLVLVDEAHHEAATTWRALLEAFPNARRVLCSATPFRNDRQVLGARIVYHYPLKKAQQDGIFGEIAYEAVRPQEGQSVDVLIARRAEEVYREDRAAHLDHRLVVRTTQKGRARELRETYRQHTQLKLEEIHSGLAPATVKNRLKKLREGELDGVICVDMLGEGLDIPTLKIAAIHAPHKSLPITLQFIGRFARTGERVGRARFIAEEAAIQHDEYNLFAEDTDWREVIANLADRRVTREVELQEFFDKFRRDPSPADDEDAPEGERRLSLAVLRPFFHVKVYRVPQPEDFTLRAQPPGVEVRYSEVSDELGVAVTVWRHTSAPKWLLGHGLRDQSYQLLVVHYDQDSQLLFICSTEKDEDTYADVIAAHAPVGAFEVPAPMLRRAMTGWQSAEIYNLGMRNKRSALGQESYRTLNGSNTHHAVSRRDGQRFSRGHAFGADVRPDGKKWLLGISSNYAKLWSLRSDHLKGLVEWCGVLAAKLSDVALDAEATPIDMLDGGTIIQTFPDPDQRVLIAGEWPYEVYKTEKQVTLTDPAGAVTTVHPSELEVQVRPDETTPQELRYEVGYAGLTVQCRLVLTPEVRHEVLPGQAVRVHAPTHRNREASFESFMNQYAPVFYFDDLSMVTRNVAYRAPELAAQLDDDVVEQVDWAAERVDIEQELTTAQPGLISVQEYIRHRLTGQHDVVFCDHDQGEAADFITLDVRPEDPLPVRLALYHVKGSGEPRAGSRVGDLYEVCGQAVKCLRFRDRKVLERHLLHRERLRAGGETRYVTGSEADAVRILTASPTQEIPVTVYIVQPGLNYGAREEKVRRLLDTVLYYVMDHASRLRVLSS